MITTDLFQPISYTLARQDKPAFARAFGESFRETGFAVVSDHPVDQGVIDRALAAAKAFFALPEAAKLRYFDPEGGGQRGYTPFGKENAKGQAQADQKEFWHTGRAAAPGSEFEAVMLPTPSVSEIAEFDAASRALFDALDEMGRVLLEAVALDLGLPEHWFDAKVAEGNSILRLLHYPPQLDPPPEGSVRAGAHEDINVITLLLGAEEAGLQAKHRTGQWLDVNPPPGSLVINCGDMLQRLTNHVLPSTTHRVLNPSAERARYGRFSMPFFLHFAPDVRIETLAQCVSPENPDRYPIPITAQDYLMERLREIGLIKGAKGM